MIGFLRGNVLEKTTTEVLIDVSGVGYKVRVGHNTLDKLLLDGSIALYIHTNVKEDAIDLYGFLDKRSLSIFELLLEVSGIGPKIALTIVGTQSADKVRNAVMNADVNFFKSIPGIGMKGAQRIIVDLKNKVGGIGQLDLASEGESELEQALSQFGFKPNDIRAILPHIDNNLGIEEQIKVGIRLLGKK